MSGLRYDEDAAVVQQVRLGRHIDATSQMIRRQVDSSYCTPPEPFPVSRYAANRRLRYAPDDAPAPHLLMHEDASTQPFNRQQLDNFSSDDPNPPMPKVTEGHRRQEIEDRLMTSRGDAFNFNDEQIDCICDALTQANDVSRLRYFLAGLTQQQMLRKSESLCKVQ